MIKLGGLVDLKPITEADVFTATSKETGTTSVFKSKAARDAAIEKGTHEKRKDDKDGAVKDPTDKPKVNIFDASLIEVTVLANNPPVHDSANEILSFFLINILIKDSIR